MPGTTRAGGYRALLTRPGVLPLVLTTSAGRLGYAMLPLLYLFTLRDAAGSFTTAATAMSMLGLAGLAMPLVARLIDRHGQRRTLPALALTNLAVVELVALLAVTRTHLAAPAWVGLAALSAVTAPPLGPSTRAQWREIVAAGPGTEVDTAYALDGTVEEVLWLVGPALAGVVLATTRPVVGLAVIPLLLVTGALGLACSRWRPAPASQPTGSGGSALRSRRLWPVLATMAMSGVAGSLTTTGVAAAADTIGARDLAAFGEVLLGVGAVAGGVAWGHSRPAWAPRATAGALLTVWTLAVATLWAVGVNRPGLIVLAVAGAVSAPLWVLAYSTADAVAPAHARTEASTWVTASANVGSSAGTALAGVLVARLGVGTPLAAGALVSAAAIVATLPLWPGRAAQDRQR